MRQITITQVKNAIKSIKSDFFKAQEYTYTRYRFNKISNFITYKEYKIKMILKNIN